VAALRDANKLSNTTIREGDVLKIPPGSDS